jgi:xylulokinase
MTTAHRRQHLLQAVLEAPCFSLRANVEALEEATGQPIETIRVEGGVVRNPIWMQLRADVTNRVMESVDLADSTAVGAALLSGVGAGCFRDHHEASTVVSPELRTWEPDPARAARYADVFSAVYTRLPRALHDLSHAINSLGAPAE